MKATCISACQIAGMGIIRPGETVELADGFYNDERIRTHFVISETSVKNRKAKPPDLMAEADARRNRFAESLKNHTAQIKALNELLDHGCEIPREILEDEDAPDDDKRISKIVELWCDNFGYRFPTDPERGRKAKKARDEKEAGDAKKEQDGDAKKEQDGESGEAKETGEDEKGEGKQMSLLDKLNG